MFFLILLPSDDNEMLDIGDMRLSVDLLIGLMTLIVPYIFMIIVDVILRNKHLKFVDIVKQCKNEEKMIDSLYEANEDSGESSTEVE